MLAHSPVPGQSNWSDITYYTAPGNGGGVLATGSASFVSLLGNTGAIPPNVIVPAIPGVTDVIRRAMENVYGRFGLGPATSYGSFERELGRRLHRCGRHGRKRRRHPFRLNRPYGRPRAASDPAAERDDTTFGPGPRTIDAQRWPRPIQNVPGCDTRSPGACWRPQDSPGCS